MKIEMPETVSIAVFAEFKAEVEARLKQIEIAVGLRFADPHELDDVGMQKDHVREQYEAFDANNK